MVALKCVNHPLQVIGQDFTRRHVCPSTLIFNSHSWLLQYSQPLLGRRTICNYCLLITVIMITQGDQTVCDRHPGFQIPLS